MIVSLELTVMPFQAGLGLYVGKYGYGRMRVRDVQLPSRKGLWGQ